MSARSLNPRWKNQDFHARIASLAAMSDGHKLLDLGCGRGNGYLICSLGAGPLAPLWQPILTIPASLL